MIIVAAYAEKHRPLWAWNVSRLFWKAYPHFSCAPCLVASCKITIFFIAVYCLFVKKAASNDRETKRKDSLYSSVESEDAENCVYLLDGS